jgi:capsular polysaccharide biosynthesis protein
VASALDKQKISNVSLAETASLPTLPAGPNRAVNILLGLFLAGFVSLGACAGAEFMRNTVHTPRELETASKYPVLATTPLHRLTGSESDERSSNDI